MSPRLFRCGFVCALWLAQFGSHSLMAQTPQVLISINPCRVVDTRLANGTFGGPTMAASSTRNFPIQQGSCGIPSSATAYLLNITVVPTRGLGYLTIWPTGQPQPLASTLNAATGQPTANGATIAAGANGGVSIYVSDATDVIVDINGYYVLAQSLSDGETPAGVEDGTNRTFTLAHTPAINSVPLFIRNGIVQRLGVDYTLNGTTITFAASVPAPAPTDVLQAWYRY